MYLETEYDLAEAVLDECSRYTPLVEPQEDGSLFCDLSGCGPPLNIIKAIVKKNYCLSRRQARISLASSRIAAENALKRSRLPNEELCLRVKRREAILVEVLPGREEEFMSSIPLREFTGITRPEVRKLERAGFHTLSELQGVSAERLASLLGKKSRSLERQIRGIDERPVLGLYPRLKISYPLYFSAGNFSEALTAAQIEEAGQTLQSLLEKRNSGCMHLSLELGLKDRVSSRERRLKGPEFRAEVLSAAIIEMLKKAELDYQPEEGRIILSEISLLEWQEQDLFSLLPAEREGSLRLEKTMERLESRFPGSLCWGKEEGRREKILACFDPLRLGVIR
jgi:nucleotidyltransferase/DNA polymerase involved in DNA repair